MNTNNMNITSVGINYPWVEKYRPQHFEKIIMDPLNKKIIQKMLDKNYFPNLLLYGPPGTGKTTTIINLIRAFQEKNNQLNKGLIIHLNASDERGIDTIRNQINQFVNSSGLFTNGIKFVILDEIDYMTKSAQYALRYLFQIFNNNVRFCLICNYISRIDESLQNEVMRIRFNELPKHEIIDFLDLINKEEQIGLNVKMLESIQELYNSDIRSMLNYIQSNKYNITDSTIIGDDMWIKLTSIILTPYTKTVKNNKKIINPIIDFLNTLESETNNDIKFILKKYFNYIIRNHVKYISKELFFLIELIMHDTDMNDFYIKQMLGLSLNKLFTQVK